MQVATRLVLRDDLWHGERSITVGYAQAVLFVLSVLVAMQPYTVGQSNTRDSIKQRLRYSLVSLESRDLETQAQFCIRSILNDLTSNQQTKQAVIEILTGAQCTR